jgi:hypothetical protein
VVNQSLEVHHHRVKQKTRDASDAIIQDPCILHLALINVNLHVVVVYCTVSRLLDVSFRRAESGVDAG